MDIGVDIGLVYHIDDAHQFWAELEDTLRLPDRCSLSQLDGRLRLYISLCSTYHENYLPTQLQLEHACCMLLDSELFAFHSERMSHLLLEDAVANTNPHAQLVLHKTLLLFGRGHQSFLRSQKKWAPLIPILMDHVLVTIDFTTIEGTGMPIEARLMTLAVGILYEVCRVQKFDIAGLRIFSDSFLDTLFDLVEETREVADETLNYSLIKLILALNEQFMVAALPADKAAEKSAGSSKTRNRVLQALVARSGASKTFAENIIFMLNRADSTNEEDLCMQLLALKILYLLFTTSGTAEFFYTNDLCVLVDVFLRELSNLPDESESLRHTYLRVFHPLLTNTQLKDVPYKRAQIVHTLRCLVDHSNIRDISPTTRRLVQRCLGAEWANVVQQDRRGSGDSLGSPTSPSSMSSFASSIPVPHVQTTKSMLAPPGGGLKRDKSLRSSASASDLKSAAAPAKHALSVPPSPHLRVASPPHNGSMVSLVAATTTTTKPPPPGHGLPKLGLGVRHPQRGVSLGEVADSLHEFKMADAISLDSDSSGSPTPGELAPPAVRQRTTSSPYRPAPPPPVGHRRKAPAPPVPKTGNGHTITTIARTRPRAPTVSS
ncbi:hypothetical protein EXIGLDRAFT_639782 [Exidia glandulosa HHB12029]|uniref:SPIN90/Ldb17 leucine-rich domain-containing protein n=1 Tax=Exidia glandulosa HHB12029 TaxID=1314781 RepID=A0A165N3G7_EXIGL|nr:hypothetical protein EXIGLDRAFT_639782 [Exidia glandulosa HHB12029]